MRLFCSVLSYLCASASAVVVDVILWYAWAGVSINEGHRGVRPRVPQRDSPDPPSPSAVWAWMVMGPASTPLGTLGTVGVIRIRQTPLDPACLDYNPCFPAVQALGITGISLSSWACGIHVRDCLYDPDHLSSSLATVSSTCQQWALNTCQASKPPRVQSATLPSLKNAASSEKTSQS